MQAKVKGSYRWRSVIACSGIEFTQSAWTDVPAGFESEVNSHLALETRNLPAPVVETFTEDAPTSKSEKKKNRGHKAVEVMTEDAEEEK